MTITKGIVATVLTATLFMVMLHLSVFLLVTLGRLGFVMLDEFLATNANGVTVYRFPTGTINGTVLNILQFIVGHILVIVGYAGIPILALIAFVMLTGLLWDEIDKLKDTALYKKLKRNVGSSFQRKVRPEIALIASSAMMADNSWEVLNEYESFWRVSGSEGPMLRCTASNIEIDSRSLHKPVYWVLTRGERKLIRSVIKSKIKEKAILKETQQHIKIVNELSKLQKQPLMTSTKGVNIDWHSETDKSESQLQKINSNKENSTSASSTHVQ